ncbi:DUF2207 domain-containing protein [Methanosphaera sp. WGK6]|uniref:DUF2207 domain-containing protein n=1 Tax=Methanosphaera sp. WGK6 TaxID=1561964 RepID=UPI00084CE4DD|nr:DUF2207 domain-containing protein [Methanosphaera sp. WGK6]OED30779.1 hypothetical protein NL43_00200 [Methanosphaera sp. WGK6]
MIITILTVPAAFADDGHYNFQSVEKNIIISDDGTAIISEDVNYIISGTINGVYRDIPLSGEQRLENISVETPGYYNTVELINSSDNIQIKVWLYKDEAKTQKVSNEDVEVIYHYNFIKGVKIYNDIAEFQYMSWGSGWDEEVPQLTTYIELPGSHENTEMWYNPSNKVTESTWTSDTTLKTVYTNLNENENVEQRILMPTSYFTSSENADVIDMDAKEKIEQDQIDYQNSINTKNTLAQIIAGIVIIVLFVPVAVYFKYGREPKITYSADYESQMPTNDSPIFINAMVNGNAGETDLDGFQAVLLDLIDKGYYKIISDNDENTVLKRKDKNTASLQQYEVDIINYLERYEDDKHRISLETISDGDSTDFSKFMDAWKIDVNKEVTDLRVSKYFDDHGNSVMSLINILSIIFGVILIVGILLFDLDVLLMILVIVLIIESIALLVISNTVMGQWTPEGKEFHDKWKNFEKYIKDYSLIKEYPPASIQVWGKYLVYATALGCADKVRSNMKKYFKEVNISEDSLYESDTVFFAYYGGFYLMNSSFHTLSHPDDSGSYGSIGDVGSGGFGGGGGGVF